MVRSIRAALIVILAGFCGFWNLRADHPPSAARPVALLPGLGKHHHPIATKSPEAQKFFDQGIVLAFGFNHPEAVRSFQKAAELDPEAPMPHWGRGWALGPNYNRAIDPVSPERNQQAFEAAQKALALSKKGPAHERAYAQALVQRYSLDPKADGKKLETAYKDSLGEAARNYPDDPDLATLYAEALMNLRPWQLWSADGQPAAGTDETLHVLEAVLERDPDHPGANHLYIHAIEASPSPQRGLPSAERLLTLCPGAGHLVHMPSHIWMHTGDYDKVALANEKAVRADEEFFKLTSTAGVYRMMYYSHNIHFLAYAHSAQGRYAEAKAAADKLVAEVTPHLKEMPMMEGFVLVPLQVELRFKKWDDILQRPAPDPKRNLSWAFWHYARGVALARTGKKKEAETERQAFQAVLKQIPDDAMYASDTQQKVLAVAAAELDARLAAEPKDAIAAWEKAVRLQDALAYSEPPDWYYPVRESLGAALLRSGQAAEAEKVFRADLKKNRRNGRSLFGLLECLRAQKKTADAEWVRQVLDRAWRKSATLRLEDY